MTFSEGVLIVGFAHLCPSRKSQYLSIIFFPRLYDILLFFYQWSFSNNKRLFLGLTTVASPETSDDFVLVPANLPVDKHCREPINSSPPRPCTLPIQIPKSASSPKKVIGFQEYMTEYMHFLYSVFAKESQPTIVDRNFYEGRERSPPLHSIPHDMRVVPKSLLEVITNAHKPYIRKHGVGSTVRTSFIFLFLEHVFKWLSTSWWWRVFDLRFNTRSVCSAAITTIDLYIYSLFDC